MKNVLKYILIAITAILGVACAKDEGPIAGSGISDTTWQAENKIGADGKTVEYTFNAAGDWTASVKEGWCSIITPSGPAGKSIIRFKVSANNATDDRKAAIVLQVKGFSVPTEIIIIQEGGVSEQGDGKYRSVNEWVASKMKECYLWNESIDGLMLDYSIDYQAFFKSILDGVAADGNINYDDGVWNGAKRESYYSQIQSNAPVSRAAGAEYNDAGFMLIQPTIVGTGDTDPIGAAVMAVTPGTPADKAGIRRGDFITHVNGVEMTQNNYKTLVNQLYEGNVTAKVNTVSWKDQTTAVITFKADVEIGVASYTDPAIYMHKVIEADGGKKIGYLLYNGFRYVEDEELIGIFRSFKNEGVTDLIIDLRYNPGGDIISSTVMNTLVVGEEYKGRISTRLVYNKSRTEAGESAEYKIGVPENVEYPNGYAPIADALGASLNLKKVYLIVSKTTASASEIIINGLRGLDIEVNLIGQRTGGKNVGMEGFSETISGYNFILYPVTFYADNEKGDHNYTEGFIPEADIDDSSTYPGDFGTRSDLLTYTAVKWIETGNIPALSRQNKSQYLAGDMNERLSRRAGGAIVYPAVN